MTIYTSQNVGLEGVQFRHNWSYFVEKFKDSFFYCFSNTVLMQTLDFSSSVIDKNWTLDIFFKNNFFVRCHGQSINFT
jgi:hypothetical protein